MGWPKDTSFCDKISCPCVMGFLSNKGVKKGYPLKDVILPLLALLGWKQLQIVADMLLIITSTNYGLFGLINIHDLQQR